MQSQQNADDEDAGAPAAAVYKTHPTSIFDLLEDLKEETEGKLSNPRKAETNSAHNVPMLKQYLVDQIAADDKDMDDEGKNGQVCSGRRQGRSRRRSVSDGEGLEAAEDKLATASKLLDGRGRL